jgi:4-hydroxy-2-oxoheptanedioate aldolase
LFPIIVFDCFKREDWMKKNLLKEKLQKGGVAAGVIMQDPAVQVVEVLGLLGFDWLFIDCEHGPMNVEDVGRLVMAAELRGITPLVRVPQNLPEIILRYLDVGAMGIIIPGVETAEEAQKAVSAAKYPPQGVRGLAGVRGADFGLSGPLGDYVKIANRETMVLAVVETRKGVENIEGILETEGIDGVSIGNNDLSQSLGVPGQTNHPLVLEAIDKILAVAKKKGKPIGGVVRGGETPKQYIEKGYQMLLTSVYGLITGAGKQFLANARG